jgi:hypothetical protein
VVDNSYWLKPELGGLALGGYFLEVLGVSVRCDRIALTPGMKSLEELELSNTATTYRLSVATHGVKSGRGRNNISFQLSKHLRPQINQELREL